MYFFRWLVKNPIIAILLGVVLYAVFNWSSLGHWFGKDNEQIAVTPAASHSTDVIVSAGNEAAYQGVTTTIPNTDSIPAIAANNNDITAMTAGSDLMVEAEDKGRSVFSRLFKRKKTVESKHEMAPTADITSESGTAGVVSETQDAVAEVAASTAGALEASQAAVEAAINQAMSESNSLPVAEAIADVSIEEKPSLMKKLFSEMGSSKEEAVELETSTDSEVASETVTTIQAAPVPPGTDAIIVALEVEAPVTVEEKKSLFAKLFPGESNNVVATNGQTNANTAAISSATDTTNSTYDNQYKDSLDSARTAFWSGDLVSADAIYQNLMGSDPANPDVFGEYGNMLYQTGRLREAVKAYEKSARLLINDGRTEEAKPLIQFIGNVDRSIAEMLVRRLNEKTNSDK